MTLQNIRSIYFLAATMLWTIPVAIAQPDHGSPLPQVTSLRDHVGTSEKVQLDVYFIGFPAELQNDLSAGVANTLKGLNIVDAQPWWIPNIPKYGAPSFATTSASNSLPSTEVPPDGLLRYLPGVVEKQVNGGNVSWTPLKEISDLVEDWHQNADIVNYLEHEGSYRGVPWKIQDIDFHFLPQATLTDLVKQLQGSQRKFTSANPQTQVTLYSYNVLMNWLSQFNANSFAGGGATLVFLNLPQEDSRQSYAFYAEPAKDVVPAVGVADSEVQYSTATSTSPSLQAAETVMNSVLKGGLTQPKMLASMDVVCTTDTTAAGSGVVLPGMLPTQPLCQQWSLAPIQNLAGNLGRRIFVSDATSSIAAYHSGNASRTAILNQIQQNAFELYRYGVLAPTIKANNVYSEAYELRTLVVDLRYDATDFCILTALKQGATPTAAGSKCAASTAGFPNEQTYQVSDVFDSGLASASLSQFNPGSWTVTMQQLTFGLQPDGTVNAVEAAETKAALRQALNQPTVTNPATGLPITLSHPPFYRTMMVPDARNNLQTITTSWENGIDPVSILTLLTQDASQGGLGIYTTIWPDASAIGEPPYHQTGKPTVKPLALILTPPPDGPLGEKWGTFPYNLTALAEGYGLLSEYGGGGWWISGGGNEEGGGLLRRDFSWVVPQYFAGPSRGTGDTVPMGVMPDGSVQPYPLAFLTQRGLEIGAPHWCNEFDSSDITVRNACRSFVKSTTTLQSIETLQHGLGYMHTAEPRFRYHFDGTESSFARLFQLITDPNDTIGLLLHQDVNMYTTAGLSTVWSQSVSEWNGVGPHAGMQASLFRSHAREEMAAAESALAEAEAYYNQGRTNPEVLALLQLAARAHDAGLVQYDNWNYQGVLNSAMQSLSLISHALTLMGQTGKLYDPLQIQPLSPENRSLPPISSETIENALKFLTLDAHRGGAMLLNAH